MKNLRTRIESLDARDIASLMNFNIADVSFGNSGSTREMLNNELVDRFESGEIDEIELIIVESGS